METNYKIYLICYCEGHPIDFLLPVYTDTQLADIKEVAGTCFKIREPHGAEVMLACHYNGGLDTLRINIESACKADSNISFSIVIGETKKTSYLRAYTDSSHNAFYPIPIDFIRKAQTAS